MSSYREAQWYVLDEHNQPVRADSLTWGKFWEKDPNRRCVAHTVINSEVLVSTVFLGFDHRFDGKGPPLLFETMVFVGKEGGDMWRYSSWDDAETGHNAVVKRLRANPKAHGSGT